jgi:hypothetical protein
MENKQQEPMGKIDASGALDLSKITEKKPAPVKMIVTPDLKKIPEELKEKMWNEEMARIASWMTANENIINHELEVDAVRKLYTRMLHNEIFMDITQRIGVSPKRIPAPVMQSIYLTLNRAISYGIYKGAKLAKEAQLTYPTPMPTEQLPLVPECSKHTHKQGESCEEVQTKQQSSTTE